MPRAFNVDAHKKLRKVTFALTHNEYKQLEGLVQKRQQPIQWVVGGFFERSVQSGDARIAMFPSVIPKVKFREGRVVSIRLSDEAHLGMAQKADQLNVSTGYLARVWCLTLIGQLEQEQQSIEKEAEDRRTETATVHDRRNIWAAMAASVVAFVRRMK